MTANILPHCKAFDVHAHFNHGSPFDSPSGTGWAACELNCRDLGWLREQYAYLGILGGGFSTFASVLEHTECIEEENDYLHALAEKDARILQWVVIDPRRPATFRQADRMLASPRCLGIKIHPVYHGYDIEEYADALFSFAAEHKTVMLMHPAKIEKMPYWADRYPEMKLIIAHLGGMEHIDAIRRAKHGNIFTDTSGKASCLNRILEYAAETVGAEKILFGTDDYSCAFQYGRVALSCLPDEDKEKILWGNAQRLFPDALSALPGAED
jgi:predicted TIM-barrel fold metal-dependent hydrolase